MLLWIALLSLLAPAAAQEGVPVLAPGQARLRGDAIGSFRGRVLDADTGEGVADVPLQLLRPSPTAGRTWPEPWAPESWNEDERLLTVETNADGAFRFDALPPGAYRVQVDDRWLPHVSADAYIDAGDSVSRQLVLEAGARITGRVFADGGQPVGNLPVFLAGLDRGDGLNAGRGRPASRPTRAAADGSFELRWVPTGTAWVQAGHAELGYAAPIAVQVDGGSHVDGVELRVPDERELLAASESGGGIGVRLDFTERGPIVASVIEDLPAARAGLLAGDLILSIDGRPTRFMTSREFIQRCRGRVGSSLRVTSRRGEGEPRDHELTRQTIPRRREK